MKNLLIFILSLVYSLSNIAYSQNAKKPTIMVVPSDNWCVQNGYVQTFTTLDAEVGLQYQMIHWESDKEYNIPWTNGDNWTDLVNNTSYTGMDGIGHTALGVWEEFVGDTITITCNYSYCDSNYINLMRIIVQ